MTRAIVDRLTDQGVEGRTLWQADDIDGITMLREAGGLPPGTIVDARIDDVVDDVNFVATVVRVSNAMGRPGIRRHALPLAAAASIGSFGR
jgi:hypothetical protein